VFRLLGVPDTEVTHEMLLDDYVMPGIVRVSFGIYNNEDEVETLIRAVKEIAAEN
jgi:selenocysteine lyase/cysteine desulfurase